MTRPLTAQIKPSTKHALMEQLALAGDEIIRLRALVEAGWLNWEEGYAKGSTEFSSRFANLIVDRPRRWWHRLMWWRK